jgi:hypothetical protein
MKMQMKPFFIKLILKFLWENKYQMQTFKKSNNQVEENTLSYLK